MEDKLKKFRELLLNNTQWPMVYYFKFIVSNEDEKIGQIKALFDDPSSVTFKTSKDIRYVSVSCKQLMKDPESIIAIYEKAALVEGVIAL